jgi:hypothetical protein
MIARVTPYCDDGQSVPNMVGVLVEGEDRERSYVPKGDMDYREYLIRKMVEEMEQYEQGMPAAPSTLFRKLAEDAGVMFDEWDT